MSPRTEHQFEQIREARKHDIMVAALELFAAEGFHTTSISKIAARAGISKGLIYNYYSSKEDLIKSIIFNGLEHITRLVDTDKDGHLTKEEMRYFLEEIFELLKSEPQFWKLYFTTFLQPQVLKYVEKRLAVTLQTYMNMLVDYFAARGSDAPETEALMFGALLDGLSFQFIINPDGFPIETAKRKLIEMYCK